MQLCASYCSSVLCFCCMSQAQVSTIEYSLFCFDWSVVTLMLLQGAISYTTLLSLLFSTLSVFPLTLLCKLLQILYF